MDEGNPSGERYWNEPTEQLIHRLGARPEGLSSVEAAERLERFGPNTLKPHNRMTLVLMLLGQLRSPLVLVLVAAAGVSAAMGDWIDASLVLFIVLGSSILSCAQEWRASAAVKQLQARVALRTTLLRDGRQQSVPASEVVPGDVVLFSAGSLIPADAVVLEARDFFVSQAVLTGETFPVEKQPGVVPEDAGLSGRTNSIFMGTSVRSGTAKALVVRTAQETEFGRIAARLSLRPPETEFERGIRRFGLLLSQIMIVLILVVFMANIFTHRPPVDSLLFAIALAVGISPELLPAIIMITLSRGAQEMARRGVIVRRLEAIENFGSMDVLCTDKTGTLTEGNVRLDSWLDSQGQISRRVLELACLNATLQTGLPNPLDEAISNTAKEQAFETAGRTKLDEIPYDFIRKRLSVIVADEGGQPLLITKGALEKVLEACSAIRRSEGVAPLEAADTTDLLARFTGFGREGLRVLGLATRAVPAQEAYTRAEEHDLTFEGFLLFADPPKAGVIEAIADLKRLAVELKIITGDSREVALHLAHQIGLEVTDVLTGAELGRMHDEALWHRAERTMLFAEIDPNQKERIILALRKMGHVVGYMGDGINDAPALHAADVGISVDSAADVAKEAADFVLMRKGLDVLRAGIEEGRATFANTLKYVYTTTSANFGNMFSMAGASILLPFLPLLAPQILLNNFLSDVPAMAIAGDGVDPELVTRPRRWDIRTIRNFMIVFGLLSSLFDFATFGVLLLVVHATPELFRTAWFVESLLTELLIALVVRTRRPFYRSRPSSWLLGLTLITAAVALGLPYVSLGGLLGFVPLPARLLGLILGISGLYVIAAELAKRRFFAWGSRPIGTPEEVA